MLVCHEGRHERSNNRRLKTPKNLPTLNVGAAKLCNRRFLSRTRELLQGGRSGEDWADQKEPEEAFRLLSFASSNLNNPTDSEVRQRCTVQCSGHQRACVGIIHG